MGKLYSVIEVARILNVTPETIKNWEAWGYIPKAARVGLQHKRLWSEWQLERILEFAKDNGYPVRDYKITPQYPVGREQCRQ